MAACSTAKQQQLGSEILGADNEITICENKISETPDALERQQHDLTDVTRVDTSLSNGQAARSESLVAASSTTLIEQR